MKTTTTGTLEEWANIDPQAMLINRKIDYMSNGCFVSFPKKLNKSEKMTYNSIYHPSGYDDYAPPYFLLGAGCPYVIKYECQYVVDIGTIYGSGTTYPIAQYHWEDPNWEKIDKIEDCFILKKDLTF